MPGIEIVTTATEQVSNGLAVLMISAALMGTILIAGAVRAGEEVLALPGFVLLGASIALVAVSSEESTSVDSTATLTALEEHYDVEFISEVDLSDRKPQTVTVRDSDGQTFNLSATITDERGALFTVAGAGLEYDGQDPTSEATSADTEAKP